MPAQQVLSINTCGRLPAPMGAATGSAYEHRQPDFKTKKVVIDYSPGPDSVSKVMRKRTLSMMELSMIDPHLCKPTSATKPEGNFEAKRMEVSKSTRKSECAIQQEDDFRMAQQLPLQQSEHRCLRATPEQVCKPKPKVKLCMPPQLSFSMFPMPMDDTQKFKQARTGKRCEVRRSASLTFPQFEEAKGKKKLRVSFANEADEDITAMYARCDPKWEERLANESARNVRKAAAEDNKSREQSKPDVADTPRRDARDTGCKIQERIKTQRPTKPNGSESLVKDQKVQVQPSQKPTQRLRLNELQKCLDLYELAYPQNEISEADQSESKSPLEVQQEEKKCKSYTTPKKYLGTCWDMYQQESSGDSKESEQMEQQYTESSQDAQKPLSGREASRVSDQLHPCGGQIYSGLNHVEFEANMGDKEQDEEEARQQWRSSKSESQESDQQRPSGPNVLAELEISRMEEIDIQQHQKREHTPRMTQKRESEDYSLQMGVIESSTGGAMFAESQKNKKDRDDGKSRSQIRGHLCQEDQKQVRRSNSQQRSLVQTAQQHKSRAERPSCVGFKPSVGGADLPRRSESEPCMQPDRRMYPSGQQSERGGASGQKEWKHEDCKDKPQPQANARYSQTTEQKRSKGSSGISSACQEALRQDAERRKKREQGEKAREMALQEAMKPRSVVVEPTSNDFKASQPAPPTCPKAGCHCSLHSEQVCKGQAKGSSDFKKQTVEGVCSEDVFNVEWVREGHLLVKLTNGKPSGAKVVSKGGKHDIYGSGDQLTEKPEVKFESDSGDATPQPKMLEEEETMEDSSMAAAVSKPYPTDLLWSGGEGENTMETTDDDPVVGTKKCCC